MAKRMTGAGVNRSAARRAAEVAALRRARQQAHERKVTEAVGTFFDRSGRAQTITAEARERADRILADGQQAAARLVGEADAAVAALHDLGEPMAEIARMVGEPVSSVRAALSRAGQHQARGEPEPATTPAADGTEPVPVTSRAMVDPAHGFGPVSG